MKKLAVVLAAFASIAGAGAAAADQVAVPGVGTLYVSDGNGYLVLADAESGFAVPGYIGITDEGECRGALNGDPTGDTSTDDPCNGQ